MAKQPGGRWFALSKRKRRSYQPRSKPYWATLLGIKPLHGESLEDRVLLNVQPLSLGGLHDGILRLQADDYSTQARPASALMVAPVQPNQASSAIGEPAQVLAASPSITNVLV